MKKHYRLVVILVVLSLVGGGFLHTVNSSASVTANSGQETTYENRSDNKQYHHYQDRYQNRYASKRYHHWNQRYLFQRWNQPSKQEKIEKNNEPKENNKTNENVNQPSKNQNEQNRPSVNQNQQGKETADLGNVSEFEKRVIDLTNNERAAYGLQPLQPDYELGRVAKEKSRDMLNYQYFDHNSPIYGSPFDMMDAYKVNYRTAGENIAKGQRSPEEVVNAWMNSEGHRANILNGSFTHIGVGFIDNGHIWTQQFIGK